MCPICGSDGPCSVIDPGHDPADQPQDPFPDVTMIDLPSVVLRTADGRVLEVHPPSVMAVQVLARAGDGSPSLIAPI